MKLKYLLAQFIVLISCGAVYASSTSLPAFDLPAIKVEDVKTIPNEAETVQGVIRLSPLVRSVLNIDMRITASDYKGFTAKDPQTGISVQVTYPKPDLPYDDEPYGLMAQGDGAYLCETVEFGKEATHEYNYTIKSQYLTMGMFSAPSGGWLTGLLRGSADENVYLNFSTTSNYSTGRTYTITGKGLSLIFRPGMLSGTVQEDAYSKKALSAILSMLMMLQVEPR